MENVSADMNIIHGKHMEVALFAEKIQGVKMTKYWLCVFLTLAGLLAGIIYLTVLYFMRQMMIRQLQKRKYWVKRYEFYCPACGKNTVYRERRYTPKPKEYSERVEVKEQYDYCSG